MLRQYAILGILILTFSASNSSKDGAPPSACVEMTPHHEEYVKQTDTSPFEIEVVSMDQQAIVVLRNITGGSFKGFMLRAVDSENVTVGHFVDYPSTAKTLTCNSTDDNVTHNSDEVKYEQQFLWQSDITGVTVTFIATFVQSFDIFWVGVRSASINV
ncbi:UNVERIFIED_CONTAM: hypothetical protein RMT77_002398 [Armadillidium vulgare]